MSREKQILENREEHDNDEHHKKNVDRDTNRNENENDSSITDKSHQENRDTEYKEARTLNFERLSKKKNEGTNQNENHKENPHFHDFENHEKITPDELTKELAKLSLRQVKRSASSNFYPCCITMFFVFFWSDVVTRLCPSIISIKTSR